MGQFCDTCKTLKKMVGGVWLCPRCSLTKEEKETNLKKRSRKLMQKVGKIHIKKQNFKTFEYNNNAYLFFEKWSDIKEAGFSLEDYIGVFCLKKTTSKKKEQIYSLCVELKYFVENRQEMVPIPFENLENIINCKDKNCGSYCMFYPESSEDFSIKMNNYKKRILKNKGKIVNKKTSSVPEFWWDIRIRN